MGKIKIAVIMFAMVLLTAIYGQNTILPSSGHERIRVVHQDISKWDKNGDGKLTGVERDAFISAKRKEMADAAAAAQAAKGKPSRTQGPRLPKPTLRPEDAQKATPKGVPKNIEEATR